MGLRTLGLGGISFDVRLPTSSVHVTTRINRTAIGSISTSLGRRFCNLQSFLLAKTSIGCSAKGTLPTRKFSPSRVTLHSVHVKVSSILCRKHGVGTIVHRFSVGRHSKLDMASLAKHIFTSDALVHIPCFHLLAPRSRVGLATRAC